MEVILISLRGFLIFSRCIFLIRKDFLKDAERIRTDLNIGLSTKKQYLKERHRKYCICVLFKKNCYYYELNKNNCYKNTK